MSSGAAGAPIVLNARAAMRAEFSGVERVAAEIVGRLQALRPERYAALSPRPGLRGRLSAQAWEQIALPARAAQLHAPLVYSPANLAPLLWPRNVVVLHDTSVWNASGSFSRAYVAWHRPLEAALARRALRIVTVSEFSKRELVDVLGLDPSRVAVVPNGVGERFTPDHDPEPVRRRYDLERPYVLMVATASDRKNLPLLGELAARLAPDGIDVAWAGSGRPYFAGDATPGGVRSLGYVPDDDLPALYVGARAFVLPSRYEGFGITCLEAMACGTPVVAADRSALPETCGDAAVLVDPDDVGAFAASVLRAASDESLRVWLRAAGLRRAAGMTWQQAALRTDALLEEVAAQSAPAGGLRG